MPESAIDTMRLSFLQWLDSEESERQAKYTQFRDYYNGDHDTQLTDRQRKFLELKTGQEFNFNLMPIVVDALAEKLKVIALQCEDNPEILWDWWGKNRMDATQGIMHLSTIRDGDAYLMVEWDQEKAMPAFTHQLAYDGSEGCHVIYEAGNRTKPKAAVKYWDLEDEGKYRRANIYYPDRIEKFVQRYSSSWQEYHEDGEEWPAPWVKSDGSPLGVPVIHFKNKEQGYSYGESELEDPIPLQNALNKGLIDLIAAADTTAFRLMWMTGGDPSGLSLAPGGWIFSTNPESKMGILEGANLKPMIELKDSIAIDIARVTRTPISHFQITGHVVGEGTLKQQESGLFSKVADREVSFGNAWEDAFYLARRLWNTYGPGGLNEDETITCMWMDPEVRNEEQLLKGLKLKRELGIPLETLWEEMGYDGEAIERIREQLAEEEAASVSNLAQGFLNQAREFDQGNA